MPYIGQSDRERLETNSPKTPGELNYLLTKLCDDYVGRHGLSYNRIQEAIGALECAKLELYRRIAAPYEDHKIDQNGDVYQCQQRPDNHPTSPMVKPD